MISIDNENDEIYEIDSYTNEEPHTIEYFSTIHGDHYRKIGFFGAISILEDPRKNIQKKYDEQLHIFNEKYRNEEDLYYMKKDRYDKKIVEAEIDSQNIDNLILKHETDNIQHIIFVKSGLENTLIKEKQTFQEIVLNYTDNKKNLILERINSTREELLKIIENYNQIYQARFEVNKLTFEDNKSAIDIKINRFLTIKKIVEGQNDKLLSKIDRLSIEGITPSVARKFIAIGITSSIAMGFFFSIFTLSKNLNDENIQFFLIKGFHIFLQNAFVDSAPIVKFLYFFMFLLAIVSILSVIGWVCYRIIKNIERFVEKEQDKEQESTINKVFIEAGDSESIGLQAKFNSSNFFLVWIKFLPYLIVFGICLIVVLIGCSEDSIKSLDTSLTGTAIGTSLTLLISGIVYIYRIGVIEDRNSTNKYYQNWELILTTLIFSISTVCLVFLKYADKGYDSLIITEFVTGSILIGFLLSYGWRIQNLYSAAQFFERKLNTLSDAIRDNSRPRPLNLTTKEDQKFKKEYFSIQRQLYDLIKQLNDNAILKNGGNPFKKFFTRKKNDREKEITDANSLVDNKYSENLDFIGFDAVDRKLFSKDYFLIKQYQFEISRLENEIKYLESEILLTKEKRSSYHLWADEKRGKIKSKINNYKLSIENLVARKNIIQGKLQYEFEFILCEMQEGFDLGIWYRENNIGPNEGIYCKLYPKLEPKSISQ